MICLGFSEGVSTAGSYAILCGLELQHLEKIDSQASYSFVSVGVWACGLSTSSTPLHPDLGGGSGE